MSERCRGSLVAESFNGIEVRRAGCGVESCDEADDNRESDGADCQPPGYIRNFHSRQILPVQVDRRSPSQGPPDQPAKRYAEESAEESHGASFRKEKASHVAGGCAK